MTFNFLKAITANKVLLIALVWTIFFNPLLPVQTHFLIYPACFFVILLASAFSLVHHRKKYIVAVALVLILLEAIGVEVHHPVFSIIFRLLQALFTVYIVTGLIRQTAAAKKVNERVIIDSVSGYLLVGFTLGVIAFSIFRLQPDAFHFPDGSVTAADTNEKISDFIYYTFVTYTTTGYGDILPVTPAMKSFAMFITITGQLYIGIIIAMLVGKFASTTTHDN